MKQPAPPPPIVPQKDRPNVLALQGEIDLHISGTIASALAKMIEKKPKKIVVDLSGVTYVDSSGLSVLIEGMQNVTEYQGEFALSGLQESVRTIFENTSLDQVFRIFPTVD